MASIPVIIKHQGKKYDVDLDPTSTGEDFKLQVYSLTGVEPDRQKILVKGGQLKDDTDLSKLGVKPGQTFMMMGTPSGGNELQRPKEAVKFVEDMTEAEAAQQVGATPAGLQNLGNTCYLNSTLQTLRAIPELSTELTKYKTPPPIPGTGLQAGWGTTTDLSASLRDLYKQMGETQDGFPPLVFLNTLRANFNQFNEKAKNGHGYAQQDAEEAWTQILQSLRTALKHDLPNQSSSGDVQKGSFIDQFMGGSFSSVTECDEVAAREAGEEPIKAEDEFLKLACHISAATNHLKDGILAGLEEKIEKNSEVLGRNAIYTKKSKISRLPKYLTVHFVRFFWKKEAQKKAKIMRKVTFPDELDVVDFCTDELKKMLIPVRDKIREVRKDEEDVERARKRQKRIHDKQVADEKAGIVDSVSESMNKDGKKDEKKKDGKSADGDTPMEDVVYKTDAEIEAEKAASILAAKKELYSLIDPSMVNDEGANKTGLYQLRGIITHQGASADSGHYTSYVKKLGPLDPKTGKRGEEDGNWWWFNDDKVSEVEAEKILTLSGGGESHSALILLYKAIPVPNKDGVYEE